MRFQVAFLGVLLVACGGSGGDSTPTAPLPTTKQVAITNYLVTSVAISAGGVNYGSIPSGRITPQVATLTIPYATPSVTYTLTKQQYSDGSFVPDDLASATVTLPNSDATLGITNIVNGQPYFTFSLSNTTGATIYAGVYSAGGLRCLVVLPDRANQAMGYYTLTATSEVRYYSGSGCTGTYRFWTTAQLNAYQASSGNLSLTASTAP